MKQYLLTLSVLGCLTACGSDYPGIVGCEAVGDIQPVCNMKTPEDIAALADGRHLLLAHFGGMGAGSTGSISLFDTRNESLKPLFPASARPLSSEDKKWGDPQCEAPKPEKFSPHGSHLHQLHDGRWRYLVVNHAERETIEMFELEGQGGESSLSWRGCIDAAEETFINDVVGVANGDVIFSRMFHHGGLLENLQSFVGIDTGDLWRWNPETGLRILPGTDALQPNGLEISADNRYVFANMYMNQEVWKVNADTGEVVATAPVANADNSAWGSDGRLWVVTHSGKTLELLACFRSQVTPCTAQFTVVAVDPETMEVESVFTHAGAPMGAATIAVPQAGRVYMGSFVGDRMISVPDFIRRDH